MVSSKFQFTRRTFASMGVATLVALWLVGVSAGFVGLANYEYTPGQSGNHPLNWPVESGMARNHQCATLMLFAHPRCPCTRATIGELELIMARCQDRVKAHVIFVRPDGVARDWVESELWNKARAIPGVSVFCDRHGKETRLFEAATSGQVLLYGVNDQLVFSGGITASRGHHGDNLGRHTIVSVLRDGTRPPNGKLECTVFGCPIFNQQTNR